MNNSQRSNKRFGRIKEFLDKLLGASQQNQKTLEVQNENIGENGKNIFPNQIIPNKLEMFENEENVELISPKRIRHRKLNLPRAINKFNITLKINNRKLDLTKLKALENLKTSEKVTSNIKTVNVTKKVDLNGTILVIDDVYVVYGSPQMFTKEKYKKLATNLLKNLSSIMLPLNINEELYRNLLPYLKEIDIKEEIISQILFVKEFSITSKSRK